ncbi:MAG: S1C family serine protease [Acidimicrobiales bacterium]
MDGEDEGASQRDPDEEWGEGPEVDRLRGWIPPDDRLWRHPSESGGSPGVVPATARNEGRTRPGPWLIGGAAACVVIALVVAGLVITTTDPGDPSDAVAHPPLGSPTTEPGLVRMTNIASMAGMVTSTRLSTVIVSADRPAGTTTGIGLVAESGGIIVVPASTLSGARSITVVEPDGTRQPADLIGTDPASGLAVVQISDDLPAATFDGGDPATGSVAFALSLARSRRAGAAPGPEVYAGAVVSVGEPAGAEPASAFATTVVRTPLSAEDVGCPLLARNGEVDGMLVQTAHSGSSTLSIFLPAELVAGVARQLVSAGAVEHGWLGVDAGDAPTTTVVSTGSTSPATEVGVPVVSVDSGSPAAMDDLAPGDVITALDGDQVQSEDELQTRLYADPPGTAVEITFEHDGTTMTRSAVLSGPDGDDPGVDPSP